MDASAYAYRAPAGARAADASPLFAVLRELARCAREALAAAEAALEGGASVQGAVPSAFLAAREAAAAARRGDADALVRLLSAEVQAEMARAMGLAKAAAAAHARRGGADACAAAARLAAARAAADEARAEAADAVMTELAVRRLIGAAEHAVYLQRTLDDAAARGTLPTM
jgi:hypothetical protein